MPDIFEKTIRCCICKERIKPNINIVYDNVEHRPIRYFCKKSCKKEFLEILKEENSRKRILEIYNDDYHVSNKFGKIRNK